MNKKLQQDSFVCFFKNYRWDKNENEAILKYA